MKWTHVNIIVPFLAIWRANEEIPESLFSSLVLVILRIHRLQHNPSEVQREDTMYGVS